MNKTGLFHIGLCLATCGLLSCGQRASPTVDLFQTPESFSLSGQEQLPRQWWLSLNDESLNVVMEKALTNNFSIKQAWDRLAQARAVLERSGAEQQPNVTLGAGASKTRESNAAGLSTRDNFNLSLNASYEIDLWGSVKAGVDAARLDAQARQEDLYTAAISLSADVAINWYRLAAALEQIQLLQEQAATQRDVSELIEEQFRHGKSRAADVFRQRQLLANTGASIERAQTTAQILRHQLSVLCGLPPRSALPSSDPQLISLAALPQTGLPAELLQQRPDLRSAWLHVLAADKRVSVAQADRYPRLSITANATVNDEHVADVFDNWLLRLVGNMVQPLFDGGSRKAEVKRVEALLQEQIHAYGDVLLKALREVEDALVTEQRQVTYLLFVTQQIEANAMVLERTGDLYLKGQVDYIRVLEAITSQLSLKQQLINSKRDLIEYRIALCRALAGSWDLKQHAHVNESGAKNE